MTSRLKVVKNEEDILSTEITVLQGRVVRKPINAKPRLKVNRGFHLTQSGFKGSFKANGKEKSKAKLRDKNLLDESLWISKYTRIKVDPNPGLA